MLSSEAEAKFLEAMHERDCGHEDRAVSILRELIELAPHPHDKAGFLIGEAICLERLRKFSEARERLKQVDLLAADVPELMASAGLYRSWVDWEDGNGQEALLRIQNVWKHYGDAVRKPEYHNLYVEIQFLRGVLLAQFGTPSEAMPVLQESLSFELDPHKRGEVRYFLGVFLFDAGNLDQGREMFLQVLEHDTKKVYHVRAHYYLGIIYARQRAHAKAIQEFEHCAPGLEEARIPARFCYNWLADCYAALGMHEESQRHRDLADKRA